MEGKPLCLLILEDNLDDAELAVKELEREKFTVEWRRVETEESFREALDEKPDLILADYSLPSFDGVAALKIKQEITPDIPLVIISGKVSEEVAVECMKAGAADYVLKDKLFRLTPVIKRALEEAETYQARKQAQEKLRRSEENYRLLAETARDMIVSTDLDGGITYANKAALEISGYSEEESLELNIEDIVPPEQLAAAKERHSKRIAGNAEVYIYETEFLTKTGRLVPLEVSSALLIKHGKPSGTLLVGRDITERKKAEDALRESEEQLQTLINAMPDFVCFKDGDGRWLNVNDASIRLFQLEGMNYRGKTDSELAELNGFLRDTFLTCEKTDANTWKERSIFREEETISHHDGIVRVFDVIKVPVFYPSGERKGLVVLGRDITERKLAEEALRLQLITLAETVSRIFNLRNPYVATHQQETARLARAVGEKMGLDEDTLQDLYIGSLLHDIGKTATPEGILRKPGKLTEAELGLVRTHPRQGYNILKDANLPSLVAELALHHHERLDGSGYPDGLKGDELGLEVRILAVCNVVNAMSLRHPYRPARSRQEISEEITNGKGTRYDPDVVDVLVEMIESGELALAG